MDGLPIRNASVSVGDFGGAPWWPGSRSFASGAVLMLRMTSSVAGIEMFVMKRQPNEPIDNADDTQFIRCTGVAISPRGDMPKNRVLFHTRAQHVFIHLDFFRQTVATHRHGQRAGSHRRPH